MNYKGEEQLLLIKALNEFDSKTSGAPSPLHFYRLPLPQLLTHA
jgi:hypothetical protein